MGRLCAVPNCPSGHDRDRTRRKRAGLRQASLFTVPKHNMARIWSQLLGVDLSEGRLVCELHFSKKSIKTEDQIRLADGTLHIIPRQKWALKEGATPVAIAEKENVECDPRILNIYSKETPVSDSPIFKALPAVQVPNVQEIVIPICRASGACGTVPATVAPIARHLAEISSNVSNDIQEHNDLREKGGNQQDTLVFADHLMETSVESSSACSLMEGSIEVVDDEPMQFLIDHIFAHVQGTPLPEMWCWVINKKSENSIAFVKIDPYSYDPILRLLVYNDLSVTVCTADEKVSIELDSTLSSIESLQTILDNVGRTIVCNGTGMQNERRDEHCAGFLKPGEYRKFVNAPRCSPCRKFRRKIQNRKNRRQTNLETRYAQSKHAANLKQRACKRLRAKSKVLLQEVVRAHQQCSAICERRDDDLIVKMDSTR